MSGYNVIIYWHLKSHVYLYTCKFNKPWGLKLEQTNISKYQIEPNRRWKQCLIGTSAYYHHKNGTFPCNLNWPELWVSGFRFNDGGPYGRDIPSWVGVSCQIYVGWLLVYLPHVMCRSVCNNFTSFRMHVGLTFMCQIVFVALNTHLWTSVYFPDVSSTTTTWDIAEGLCSRQLTIIW